MGLKPLEYSDCLLDSPYFRESIHDHEKELDQTNNAIKALIKECQNLIKALENLSKAQTSFGSMLENFKLRYVGEVETDDDYEYEDAFPLFSQMIAKVEEERERMLDHANIQLIEPLERFRKEQIGGAKEEKKKFDRETERICTLLENHLKTSPKKKEVMLQEYDSQIDMQMHQFRELSLDYVTKLQEVNEKKKFELVEIILAFMYGQSTFFHNGHEVFEDHKNHFTDLQIMLQNTRERYGITKEEADDLKTRTKKKFMNGDLQKGMYARQGYLYVHERKKSVLGQQWTKHYCMYTKENKILTMIPYTQTNTKLNTNTDTLLIATCVRRPTETSERRFLFDITGQDSRILTMQCLNDEDRKMWLEVMEGKEPIYMESNELKLNEGVTTLDVTGIKFVKQCMDGIERRGLTDQGIYRIAGVSSKFNRLLTLGTDPKQLEKLDLISDDSPWEVKTITSAMKQYFRNLSEPIFTFKLHHEFLNAIKLETHEKKISKLKELAGKLPSDRERVLNRLMYHLMLVAAESKQNLMQESNLAVVLGPTLMRPKEETMAALMSIKFQSIVIETIIKEYNQIFCDGPPDSLLASKDNVHDNSSDNSRPSNPLQSQNEPFIPRSPSSKYRAPEPPLSTKNAVFRRSESEQVKPPKPPILAERPKNINIQSSENGKLVLKRHLSNPNPNLIKPKHQPPARPSGSGSLKRQPPVKERPDPSRIAGGASGVPGQLWYTEAVSPFTSLPEEESSDVPNRRESYALAMSSSNKSNEESPSQEPKTPPPVSQKPKPNGAPPKMAQRPMRPGQPPPQIPKRKEWRMRALYDCVAGNTAELSFNKGAIISNVKSSTEEGWLIGMLNGKTGLIPENYCEKIQDPR